jgi:endonuclease III
MRTPRQPHPNSKSEFQFVLGLLEKHYGRPAPPVVTDPFEQILLENVVYLANDERRMAAFTALKKCVGLRPDKILAASDETLLEIARMGSIVPEVSVRKMREVADIAKNALKGNLRASLKKPFREAVKDMKLFPGIGDPGAEKILLFARSHRVLAFDSNGLRVVRRLGFSEEKKNYSASYRAAQEALQDQLPADFDSLIRAYQLLRRHGKELCKTSRPLCGQCPLQLDCRYFKTSYHPVDDA